MNEAERLDSAVASATGAFEVIVADGGSADSTIEAAERCGARVVSALPGRGGQMDAAAAVARGDVLLFLHADTVLPNGWKNAVERVLSDPGVVAGGFTLSIDSRKGWFRLVERAVRWRYRALGLIYGDQAAFVRKDVFMRSGGFKGLPLMEDVDCVRRLWRSGRVVLLDERAVTSARRWERKGALRATLKNWAFLSMYYAGVAPERLYGWYYGNKGRK